MNPAAPVEPRLRAAEYALFALGCAALLALKLTALWPADWIEVIGFASGGACVWLQVRRHRANWPISLLNNAMYFAVFLNARLYADTSLQAIYFALGVYGWWNWSQAREVGAELRVGATRATEWAALLIAIPLATVLMHRVLSASDDPAPLLDALTTAMSLAAQWLLSRRRVENWLLWIAVDLIYVPLYWSRELHLTALLYAVFLLMCVQGWRDWRRAAIETRA